MKPSNKADHEGEKPREFWVGLVLLVLGCLSLIIFFPQIFYLIFPILHNHDVDPPIPPDYWKAYIPHATITVILIFAGLLMMTFKLKKP